MSFSLLIHVVCSLASVSLGQMPLLKWSPALYLQPLLSSSLALFAFIPHIITLYIYFTYSFGLLSVTSHYNDSSLEAGILSISFKTSSLALRTVSDT